jgi:hypothetical protein
MDDFNDFPSFLGAAKRICALLSGLRSSHKRGCEMGSAAPTA